ncbi:MAG: peroxiredoxin family protein [Mangrovibacterium sp.]
MKTILASGIIGIFALLSYQTDAQTIKKLKDGRWYAEFTVKENRIPFVFEVKSASPAPVVTLINGAERVKLSGITYKGDSVFIPIKDYDTRLKGVIQGDTLKGTFVRLFSETDPGTPFTAVHGNKPRFNRQGESGYAIKGRWDIKFLSEQNAQNNVGIFDQKDGILTGSVLTNSGDLRFLEGVIDQQGFRLSAFAGLSPYLITGRFTGNDQFEGEFITSRQVTPITGTRNEQAALADPYSLTNVNSGYQSLGFKLPDMNGKTVSLSDPKFKNKVVVVSILGSWCPNCLDEAAYLSPWYKQNKDRGVEIVGLAFERKDDPAYVKKVLTNLISKYDITYDILFGGKLGTSAEVLPEIDGLKSYPTTIFIDKKGKIRKIHTGFNGPATGLFYEEFKSDFNNLIDQLLKE